MRPAIALILLVAFYARPAVAAESYDNCSGFIDSVPTTITTQGVWCLRADLSTNISSGPAINVAVNNVTVDCNHFKLGGLSAGEGTTAVGIRATARLNTTVRNCNVRGFSYGARLDGGGHVLEDSRFEANRISGVLVSGDGSIVRRNQVIDTGGSTVTGFAAGIATSGGRMLIEANVVDGVAPTVANPNNAGIWISDGSMTLVQGNYVSGLTGTNYRIGLIATLGSNVLVRGNSFLFAAAGLGYGTIGEGATSLCRDNVFVGMEQPPADCTDLGGNSHVP